MIYVLYHLLNKTGRDLMDTAKELPKDIRDRLSWLKDPMDKQRLIVGRLLLKKGLDYLRLNDTLSIDGIKYSKFAKPYFIDSQVSFSISHAHECVLCSIATNCIVGIDVEYIRPFTLIDLKNQIPANDWQNIAYSKNPLLSFYRYWTERESIVKADGRGLSIDLSQIKVQGGRSNFCGSTWHLQEIPLIEDYVCTLAINDQKQILHTRVIEEIL